MNYFLSIVLCIATVSAEAIPEALTLGPIQNCLYEQACKKAIALKFLPPALPAPVPAAKPTPLPDSMPDSVSPAVPRPVPAAKPTSSSVPDSVPPAVPRPVPGAKPLVVPVILSPEVEAAKARAMELYGKEPGFVGVTDRIVRTRDGKRFLYINIKADGNCGFYAAAVDRPTFVATIKDLVNEQHDGYQAFVKERSDLVRDIGLLMSADDKADIVARAHAIDSSGDVTQALKLLTEFATEKQKYQAELFLDARNALIKQLQDLEALSTVSSKSVLSAQVADFINAIASARIEDTNVADLTRKRDELVASLTKAGVNVKKIQDAFAELMGVFRYGDVELFEKAKLLLSSKILNLTALSSCEAFLTALREELMKSGVKAAELTTKDKVLAGVSTVFAINRGSAAWIPGGLLAPIAKRLGIEYNIWARDSLDFIKLYSSSGDGRGVAAKGSKVRNVYFTGGHYDMLIPIDE